MEGTITKLVAGVYTIHTEDNNVVECKARGVFRNKGITPLVGDRVVLDNKDGDTVISKVLPRKNQFIRPAIANIALTAPQTSRKRPIPPPKDDASFNAVSSSKPNSLANVRKTD